MVMADDSGEGKRERGKRRKRLERTLKQRKSQRGATAAGSGATMRGNYTSDEKQPRKKIQEKDITGLKYFDKLAPLLERLHDDACQRDTAGNRRLHFDQYCMLIATNLSRMIHQIVGQHEQTPPVPELRSLSKIRTMDKTQRVV